ncbi:MAG: uracil phosphoribosyltransferase [Alphaproteobacteria bacterium]|nr:uracil phosphoribosyltransferase [Alphaproteobacteria bacterium]
MSERFPSLNVLDHPLIRHKLTRLRDRTTPPSLFRQLLKEISLLIGYEVTRPLPIRMTRIQTPLATMEAPLIKGKEVAVVPVLRAGLGMAEGLLELVPDARIGHIGLYRDPRTKRPVQYLVKLPPSEGQMFILVDPMLATGHSAAAALDILNQHGVPDERIRMMALVAAPEGVAVVQGSHAKVQIFVAALDERLDENAYIVPGLGDAGDRIFGTDHEDGK